MGIESDTREVQEFEESDTAEIRKVLEIFVDELADRLSTHELEEVLAGEKTDLTSADLGQKPESFAEQYLIYPLMDQMGLEFRDQPYGQSGDRTVWPDSEIRNLDQNIANEHKALNNVEDGVHELTVYLDSLTIGADYGIVTDGIEWRVMAAERGGDVTDFPQVEWYDLRPALIEVALERGHVRLTTVEETEVDEEVLGFMQRFARDSFDEFTSIEAPQMLRDARKNSIEEFYELYIELLFGKSDEYQYDTCLLSDIHAPPTASEAEKRRFAVTLVNRLLFIKVLEDKGVVPERLLLERVEVYEKNVNELVTNLYGSQLEPLFYDLLNVPRDDRRPHLRTGWFEDIPYLNGGLFRPIVDDEEKYDIGDQILIDIIRKLIEGSELTEQDSSSGIDPAVIGSVFEKTINFIGGESGTQKSIGAYYTPSDVTQLITEETVDPKIKDIIIDSYAEVYGDDSIRERMEDYALSELLLHIEEGEGWFGDPIAAEKAYEQLGELTALDPACGSGHFLTSVMDQIHRARRALYRGLNQGEDPGGKVEYESRKELALGCIYGVDINAVAVEIARLRVWLKILEDGWKEDFGRLPNIELNIVPGNSLLGLPVKMEGQLQATVWDDRLEELIDLRREYKSEEYETEKEDVLELRDEVGEGLDDEYLKRLSHTATTKIESPSEWRQIIDDIGTATLHPTIQSVKIAREDGSRFEDDEVDRLEDMGFRAYTYSARLDIRKRHEELTPTNSTRSKANIAEEIATELASLLNDGYIFEEVARKPLQSDLEQIPGRPFHWVTEFPEVATNGENGNGHEMAFDIVVGNPPYGDLLDGPERIFIPSYETASINEISTQFVERQFQLLDDDGYFGNITTLRLVFQSNHNEFHDLLRENLDTTRISCFGLRGRTGVFDNALIRVGVFSGQKNTSSGGDIQTSDLILFTEDNRRQRFENIEVSSTEGLALRDSIGGGGTAGPILPKVGPETKRELLTQLREQSDVLMEDIYTRKEPDTESFPVILSESGGYWINPMIEEITRKAGHRDLYFDNELEQKTAFLVYSSSLYYCYWITYGDQRHHTLTEISAFPWPIQEKVDEYEESIHELAELLWERMKDIFTGNSFQMASLRMIIDDVDALVGRLYGLDESQIEYTTNYHADIGEQSGREGIPDSSLTYDRMFD